MKVYRLTKEKYKDSLSGKGAALKGGRWNSAGIELIYTASNRALAMSEVAVHISYELMADNYWIMEIELPQNPSKVSIKKLSENWNAFPYIQATRDVGDRFVHEGKHLSIKVPSAVVQGEWNVLINPNHKDFKRVRVFSCEPFRLDRRLF